MLGGRNSHVSNQNQIVQSGNKCYSFMKVVAIDEIFKKRHRKILIQSNCPNPITLHARKEWVHSAKIAALAPGFEKSATELKRKPKQKLLQCRSLVHIATFNGRTLNRLCHLPELTAFVVEHNIDIICIQEHRYYYNKVEIKYHDTGNGWMFVSEFAWKNSINAVIEG